jgi:hypothetical protein
MWIRTISGLVFFEVALTTQNFYIIKQKQQ